MIKGRKRRQEEEKIFLADGVILRLKDSGQEENRVYTLILKGILVYLIVMGGMGCFLSSLQVEYASWVLHIIVLLSAVFCSMLYYHKMWENIGYIMLLVLLIVSGGGLRIYINSGFYAVANDMAEEISNFFGRNVMRNYGEQVGNRYLAVTISMCFIGCVCCILMNVLISRRMRYYMAILVGVGMLLMPMYLELEPDGLYIAMYLGGLLSAYIIRCGGHYQLRQGNAKYELQRNLLKKRTISYVYAGRTLAAGLAAVFLICFLAVSLMEIIYPKEQFQAAHIPSGLKKRTMDTVENISLSGLMGLFNFYPNTGGLTSGTLGGVSSVRLDFQPDLRVEFAPYSEERLYFKFFTGELYLPYSNRWSRLADEYGFMMDETDDTVLRMKEQYEAGREYTARGIMKITNVAAAVGPYLPYYSEDTDIQIYPGQTGEYTYYPRVSREALTGTEENWMGEWLVVPEENWEVIAAFCEEAGLSEETMSTAEIVSRLTHYYQDNIPYTLRPGLTPNNKDFVNYFLEENRRGYCAHFASASTLIFRYLGIPARYVEGYAIDPTDIFAEGTRLEEARYEEYYEGYSPLGVEAVVSVDATDANAHAWVEIYDEALGWQVVEVTPASGEEEETDESLWQRLLDFLGDNDGAAEEASDDGGQTGIALNEETRQLMGRTLCLLAGVAAALFAGRQIVLRMIRNYRYQKADRNEKLIMRYQEYIRKIGRKNRDLTKMVNYEEQLGWLLDQGFWEADEKELSESIRILERAGFSRTEIDEAEFAQVVRYLVK